MKKIGDITNTADKNGEFTDGNVAAGTPPTQLMGAWFNSVQREILNVLAKAGIPQSATKEDQLAEAIIQIISNGKYASTAYVDNGLNKKIDKANISGVKGNDNDKVPSLNLLTIEIGKLQPKGEYAPMGYSYSKDDSDSKYATNTALNNGLNGKFDKIGGKLSGGIAATGISAEKINSNHRASIYPPIDDNENSLAYFQYNLGSNWFGRLLIPKAPSGQTISILSTENISHFAGSSTNNVISQKGATDLAIGFNQKFEDVKSQREKNVLYTNSTSKPIFIMVSVSSLTTTTGVDLRLYIDGVEFKVIGGGSANSGTFKGAYISAIVPSSSTYKVVSGAEIESWGELR
ncbi:hypothetical protein AAEZ94_001388 [Providencia rettgeri]|nr:hypothetical protein [Providencia rettgeri]EIU9513997.1 hypothetical protein [Providencia rettgeri]ELR5094050.1 hypothetical protein [Providencia rettgeri]